MQIASKSKGKAGGARVITMNICIDEKKMPIALLYVYDKAEVGNIKDEFLQQIIKELGF